MSDRTVADLLLARQDDDREALRFEGQTWTWRQVVDESARRAHALRSFRAEGPFHVGVMLENVPEFVFLLGGAALVGAVIVGINPTRRGAERAADVRHTDCQLVLTDERRAEVIGNGVDLDAARILDVNEREWLDVVASCSAEPPRTIEVTPDSLYLLIFTSGSTGAPKAVRCTQGRMAFVVPGFDSDAVLYCAMPLFHGNALISNWVPAMSCGATIVLKRRFSASAFLDDIREHGVTFFNTVGQALAYILATPPTPHDRDHPSLVVLAPEASAPDMKAFQERFGCFVVEGYGSSEGAIRLAPTAGTPRGSLGKPLGNADIAVVDPATGAECSRAVYGANGGLANPEEAIGELVRRDPETSFAGYYNNDEAQAERLRDGWFWSGDLAYRDEDGFFFFAGRTADWIRVDGENFATAPVERILRRHPDVAEVAVFGVPDPRAGDRVMATVVLAPGRSFDAPAFHSFLDEQPDLGTKWAPRFVRIVDRLPVTATSKVDKRSLRATCWFEGEVWWQPGREPVWRPMSDMDRDGLRAEFASHGREAFLGR
ncbi:MAG: AMP-binding protein [Actinobacteria bacterium]|nr:AMP-binding protein [Actinomycetota bacterium]